MHYCIETILKFQVCFDVGNDDYDCDVDQVVVYDGGCVRDREDFDDDVSGGNYVVDYFAVGGVICDDIMWYLLLTMVETL